MLAELMTILHDKKYTTVSNFQWEQMHTGLRGTMVKSTADNYTTKIITIIFKKSSEFPRLRRETVQLATYSVG